MGSLLPNELLLSLNNQIPCREQQIRQVATLIDHSSPSPLTLVIQGGEATGKSLTIEAVLKALQTPSTIVQSRECITTRHLLERTLAGVKDTLKSQRGNTEVNDVDGRCENISAFVVELQRLLEGRGKHILVFDGVDRQREVAPTLLPAIARLGETIPDLITILVVGSLQAHLLHRVGVPHVHYPPYTRAESLSILSRYSLQIHDSAISPQSDSSQPAASEDSVWLWSRFTAAVWDSLGQSVARDVVSFREVCSRLWKPFIQPVLDGYYGAREFSKLMVKNRGLFQSELALVDSIVPIMATDPNANATRPPYNLLYYPSYLLLASYLASYNPSKYDITLFSKSSLSKRRKRGGGTALTSHRVSKHRRVSRKLLGPQPFPLERLFAIFHAILPHTYPSGGADIMCQLATLAGLRLMIKSGGTGDILEGATKWKVNVGWQFVRGVAGGVGFDIENYLHE